MKSGKEYELLIEKLYRELEPNAEIIQDDHIYGRDTNSMRQIDVSIRYKFLGLDNLIIVQAKDYKIPADMNKVGEFLSVIKDVNANKGILICSKGFSKKAIEYAKNKGVELLTIHSANNKNWETLVQIKVKKTIYNFKLHVNFDLNFIGDGKTSLFRLDYNCFSYDKKNIFGMNTLLQNEVFSRIPVKKMKINKVYALKVSDVYHIFNNTFVSVNNLLFEIVLVSTSTKSFYFKPDNYIVEKNHNEQLEKLHNLTLSIESIRKIIDETEGDIEATIDREDLGITIFNYNDEDKDAIITFNKRTDIEGGFVMRDNRIVPLDVLDMRVIELENIFSERE